MTENTLRRVFQMIDIGEQCTLNMNVFLDIFYCPKEIPSSLVVPFFIFIVPIASFDGSHQALGSLFLRPC